MSDHNDDEVSYPRLRVLASAAVGIGVAFLSVGLVSAVGGVFYENLFRVGPTVAREGVGSDWVVGNTVPWLDFAISLVHAADVIMGGFILVMIFIHWAAFRRLGDKMRDPDEPRPAEGVATDGGPDADAGAGGGTGADLETAGGESR